MHRPGPPSLSVLPDRGIYKAGLLRSWPVAEHRGKSSLLVVPNSQLAPGPPSLGLLWVRRKELRCHCTRRYSKPTAGERNARLSRPQPVVLPVCTLRGAESTTARIVAPPPRRAARARAHTHNERTLCARICRSGAPIEYSEYRKVLTACGCGCGGRGRADRSMAGFYLPASKAGSCTRGRWWTTYARVLTVAERTRHAIVPGFPASHERAHVRTNTHTHTWTSVHISHTHTHTHTRTHSHSHSHSLTHSLTHTCTHARTHTHSRTRTHSRNMRAQCFADPFVRSAKLVSFLRFRRDP